jgi:hypothetical protein
MALHWKSEEAAEIAQTYMQYHPELIGAAIAFVFKEKASKRDGQPIVAKVGKVPPQYACLMEENDEGETGYDYIVTIGADAWSELNNSQKAAWLDHCLEQCYGEETDSGEMRWKMRKPEISTFSIILARHGTQWDTGVNKLRTLQLSDEAQVTEPIVRVQEPTEVSIDNA